MSEYIYATNGELVANIDGDISLAREEVVRCRDCIYYAQDSDPIDPGWPMMCERTGDDMVEPYGFCSWGERKEA